MAFQAHRANDADNPVSRQHREESESYYGIGQEAGGREVRIGTADHIVEIWSELPKLRTQSTNQEIAVRRKLAE